MTVRAIAYVMGVAALTAAFLPVPATSQEDRVSPVMTAILEEWASIHPGDKETKIEKYFLHDGGLYAPDEGTFISRRCSYVKIDVKFRDEQFGHPEATTIVSISRPYLDYPKAD
jgi:hypothetical protein